jgi:hypothetical protein
MKQKSVLLVLLISMYAMLSTGCATIFKGSESSVYFLNGPTDLKIYDETGKQLSLEQKEAKELYGFSGSFKDENNSTRTTYYAYGYTFPDASKTYNLTLQSGSTTAKVTLEPSMAMRWFWLDLFSGGIIVDAITGDWHELAEKDGEMNQVNVSKYLK